MRPSILTVTQVNQNFSRARKAVEDGPVIITERGEPSLVLMQYSDFKARQWDGRNLLERIDVPGTEEIDVDFPKLGNGVFRPVDF